MVPGRSAKEITGQGALMTAAAPASTVRTELSVDGMHCGNCVRHVEEALGEIAGVRAEVDLDVATAVVTHPAAVSVQSLLDAVVEAGYEVALRG
jgi:P-type Cu+ transporter